MVASMLVVAILVGGGAFYGGIKYAEGKSKGSANAAGNFQGARGTRTAGGVGGQFRGQNGAMGLGTVGDVLSKDDKSITVKLRDGGSKIVFYTSSTTVRKTTDASLDDVKEGASIVVQGQTNTDGSVTAQSIQLRSDSLLRVMTTSTMK